MARFTHNAVLENIQRTSTSRPRSRLLLVSVIVGHVVLISSQVHSGAGVPVLEAVTFSAFSHIQQGTAGVIRGVRDVWFNYADLRGARAENEELRSRLNELEIRLQEQRTLAERSVRLQALLNLKESVGVPTVAASVIAGYANPGMLTITIDKGSRDGVLENMAVVAASGVVGRVIGPIAGRASRVQLIVDSTAAAGALTERTRAGGMVVGQEGDPPLRMELVSNLADVQPGDVVVTSGADGIYPRGFVIGRVESSERGPQLYRTITVRPTADFRALEEVLVVLVPPRSAMPEDDGEDVPGGPG
jgi:rod shape-determining protein MreC